MRIALLIALLIGVLVAQESHLERQKLAQKGEKIANALCQSDLIPSIDSNCTLEEFSQKLKASHACNKLSKSKEKALLYYLYGKEHNSIEIAKSKAPIAIPHNAKCPVCGMFIYKYPKWAAHMVIDGKDYYFDGVKDMMKFYIFDGDFPYDRKKISLMEVNDYYTLQATNVKDAYFVYDSDLFGPMGRELIPFGDEASAKTFMRDHHGKSILRFDAITDAMVMALDD